MCTFVMQNQMRPSRLIGEPTLQEVLDSRVLLFTCPRMHELEMQTTHTNTHNNTFCVGKQPTRMTRWNHPTPKGVQLLFPQ